MIRALIVDDEQSVLNVVRMLIERHIPEITSIESALGASDAKSKIVNYKPDLVFMDIEMPFMTGFELLQQFPEHSFEVIFVTAYDHYAIKAIRFSALDYLLKPVDTDELKLAVKRFIEKRKTQEDQGKVMANFMQNISQPPEEYRLAIHTTEGTHFLKPEEIIRCEADGNYTRFILHNRKAVLASRTLKEFDEILSDYHFIRIHKSHLVNKKYIQSFASDHVVLRDQSMVEVSRRRSSDVKDLLN